MKLKALKNHIIVEKPEPEEKSEGGIYVPASKQEVMEAEVVSVGDGIYDDKGTWRPSEIKVGDTVLFPVGTGQPAEYEGTEYIFFKPEDILAIIKDNG